MRRHRGHDFRAALHPLGVVLASIGALIAACAAIGAAVDAVHPLPLPAPHGLYGMIGSAVLTLAAGLVLMRNGRTHRAAALSRRDATMTVAMIWLCATAFGALPFVLGARMSPHDALFEAASGLTTTGATVLGDIERTLSRPMLLWRSLIQWLGGMGIVVLFVAVFPNVGVGGRHMFQGEVPGTTADALTPRIAETSFALWKIYAALTAALAALLALLGMDPFEAVCHAFTTLSTGGFSTRDASVGAWQAPSIQLLIATFMFIASLNFGLFFAALRRGSLRGLLGDRELRTFLAVAAVSVAVVAALIRPLHDGDTARALGQAYFMVATFMSSTGFTTDDYGAYPSPATALIVLLMLVGGCSGSTAGGVKVERVLLLVKQAASQVRRSFRPNVVEVVRVGRRAIDPAVLEDVAAFFFAYLAVLAVGVVVLTFSDGISAPTALGAALTSLSNMGPAPFHEGPDHFANFSVIGKLTCAALMLLGRLELFTLLALLTPAFWRR